MENSPHSPGRKPFVGGARQLFNSGVNYKKMISSTPAVRAQRVLDRMPRNILERDGQQGLHSMMTGTFVTQGAGLGEQPSSLPAAQNKRSALSATKGANVVEKRDDRVRTGSDMSVFDTFSYGFDLPAGVQLNRINRKLHYWETTRDHIEERKAQREMWAKELLKKEQRKENKMRDAFK